MSDPVTSALSGTVQKLMADLKAADKDNERLRKALLEAASYLRMAGYHSASEKAKDAAT